MEVIAKYLMLLFLALFSSIGLFLISRSKKLDKGATRRGVLDPGHPSTATELDEAHGLFGPSDDEFSRDQLSMYYFRAIGYLRHGKVEEAIQLLQQAAQMVPGNQSRKTAKQVFQLLASIYEDLEEYFRSLQTVEMALSYFPGDRGFTRARNRLIDKISKRAIRPRQDEEHY